MHNSGGLQTRSSRLCLALLLLLLVGLSACGQSTKPLSTKGQALPTPAAGAALTFPDDRAASGLTETIIAGKDALQRSAGASEMGTALQLAAGGQHAESAVYRFNAGTAAPDSVSVQLEEGVTAGAFIGLANFATQHWDFSGPFIKAKTLALDDAAYVSQAGNIWIAVLTPAGTSALINTLSIRTIGAANLSPIAKLVPTLTSGAAPLVIDFDASGGSDPDGQIVEYAWDWDGDGLYDGFTDSSHASHSFAAAGMYTVKLRVTDDQFARATAVTQITVTAQNDMPPVASFALSNDFGTAPLTVSFDASASHDPDGSIAQYAWDWDGDGAYESFSTDAMASHVFTQSGVNTVRLRVTDSLGGQATKVKTITLTGWAVTAAPLDAAGKDSAMCLIAGSPAVAYYTATGHSYLRAKDNQGSEWDEPVVVSASAVSGYGLALCEADGAPAIAYLAEPNNRSALFYVRATNSTGSNWSTPVQISSTDDAYYPAMTMVNGRPAVAFDTLDTTAPWHVFYVRSDDADGTSWPAPFEPDPGAVVDTPSLAMVNGTPAISYYDYGANDLKYIHATDADGSVWGAPLTLDTEGGVYSMLAVIEGNPAIGYDGRYHGTGGLSYIRAVDAEGAAWGPPLQLDQFGYGRIALTSILNFPVIVYSTLDNGQGMIKLVIARDFTGQAWEQSTTLAPVGGTPSIVGDFEPIITFNSDKGLQLARKY